MNKYIVITSIFDATTAVRKYAKLNDWHVVVVGDTKTPSNWQCDNVKYLSLDEQEQLGYLITKQIPKNSYTRKMIGYQYAIRNGADIIADTDDDNIPYSSWGKNIIEISKLNTIINDGFVNVYSLYTEEKVWPRGFPLERILEKKKIKTVNKRSKIGVWQFLANKDPDVDAIYRLTSNKQITFKGKKNYALGAKSYSPINSQNTFFIKKFFPLLYLPTTVSFRFTDILRGYVLLPLLWTAGYTLGIGPATVYQKRNPHNYLKDFESEVPFYINTSRITDLITSSIKLNYSIEQNLILVYEKLHENRIVRREELETLNIWLKQF